MAFFPFADGAPRASGALVKGDEYVPSHAGPIVYFAVDNADGALARAGALGATVVYSTTALGDGAHVASVAEFADSQGHRLALHVAVPGGTPTGFTPTPT